MSSNERSDHLDLARGLPTTARDVEALPALRYPSMTDDHYVRFLAALAATDRATLAEKRGPHGAGIGLVVAGCRMTRWTRTPRSTSRSPDTAA